MEKQINESELSIDALKEFMKEYKVIKAKDDFLLRSFTLIAASLGLVTALAWEEAAKGIFISVFGGLETISEKLLYAIIITGIAVIISLFIGKIFLKKKE
jgi:hypothetical protein